MRIRHFIMGSVLVTLMLPAIAYSQSEQSLAEVVKAQKPAKKAAKVYTNDDMPSPPAETPSPAETQKKTAEDKLKELRAREDKLRQEWRRLDKEVDSETEPKRREELMQRRNSVERDLWEVSSEILKISPAKPPDPPKTGEATAAAERETANSKAPPK